MLFYPTQLKVLKTNLLPIILILYIYYSLKCGLYQSITLELKSFYLKIHFWNRSTRYPNEISLSFHTSRLKKKLFSKENSMKL